MLLDNAPIAVKKELNIKKDPSPMKPVKRELDGESDEEDYVMLDAGTSSTQVQPDPGRAPGRIIGSTRPLEDFKANLTEGDIVSKAVEDLAWVSAPFYTPMSPNADDSHSIQDILERPFSSRRTDELMGCMTELRRTCLQVSLVLLLCSRLTTPSGGRDRAVERVRFLRVALTNAHILARFIRELKDKCHDDEWTGNKGFWKEVQKVGRSVGLIAKAEAEAVGGRSRVSENTATKARTSTSSLPQKLTTASTSFCKTDAYGKFPRTLLSCSFQCT